MAAAIKAQTAQHEATAQQPFGPPDQGGDGGGEADDQGEADRTPRWVRYHPAEQRDAHGEWTDGGRHFAGFTGKASLQYARGEQPAVKAALKTILGRSPKDAEVARLFGAPDGAKVRLSLQGTDAVHASVQHRDWQNQEHTLYLERPGQPALQLDRYRTAPGVARGQGLGTAAFGT